MTDDLFTDEPAPKAQGNLFADTPAPERGMFGQTLEKPPSAGWNIAAGTPIPLSPENETRNEPGLQDVSVNDALAAQGVAGLGKFGVKLAGKGIGAAMNAIPATENLLPSVERIANNQTLKSMGGTMGQLNQMAQGSEGRGALDKAAEFARDKGLADVFSTSIGRDKQLAALKEASGKTLGTLRAEAGNAPAGIPEKIAADLESKYGPDALRASESPSVEKALKTVKTFGGETPPSTPDLPVIEPGSKTGDPYALFAYNEHASPNFPAVSKYQLFGDPQNPIIRAKGFGTQMTADELKQAGIPITGRTPRSVGKWEPLDLTTPGTPPTHAGYAKAATELNDYAAGNKMYQPVTAESDVANALSRENNQGIVQSLGSEKGEQYLNALEEQKRLHPLEHLQARGELREAGGRGGQGLGKAFVQKLADSFGYRLSAQKAAALHDLLSGADLESTASGAMAAPTPLNLSASKVLPSTMSDFMERKYGRAGK